MSEYEQLGEVTTVHRVDVFREDGIFFNPGKRIVKKGEEEVFWKHMQQEVSFEAFSSLSVHN